MTKALATAFDPSRPLKDRRQERFCQELLIDANQTKAAIRAGYSPKTAQEQSSRLLSKVMVRARADYLSAERNSVVGLTGEWVVRLLMEKASVDLADAIDADGNWLPVHKIPAHVRRCLAGVEVVEMASGMSETGVPGSDGAEAGPMKAVTLQTRKLKLVDPLKALELLAKHKGLLIEKKEVTGVVKHDHTHRLSREQADAAYRAAGMNPPIEGEAVAA